MFHIQTMLAPVAFFLTDTVTEICLDRPFSVDLELSLSLEARNYINSFRLEDISSSSRRSLASP